MKPFNELCKIAERLSPEEYAAVILEKTHKIVPALHALTQDPAEVTGMLVAFLTASVYADGKLDESEYGLIYPFLTLAFGEDVDYSSAKAVVKAFKPEGKELKELVDRLVDFLGMLSEDLKDDIVVLCLLICAVDGKVSAKEKNYIKQLLR